MNDMQDLNDIEANEHSTSGYKSKLADYLKGLSHYELAHYFAGLSQSVHDFSLSKGRYWDGLCLLKLLLKFVNSLGPNDGVHHLFISEVYYTLNQFNKALYHNIKRSELFIIFRNKITTKRTSNPTRANY